ncbi:hypothetical protein LC607_07590 [Nostoc sp. CHAB 5824]|nr:hypothetical protein [Nostoc sp. CHAB 5824]
MSKKTNTLCLHPEPLVFRISSQISNTYDNNGLYLQSRLMLQRQASFISQRNHQ